MCSFVEYADAQEFKTLGSEITNLTCAVKSLENTLKNVVNLPQEQYDPARRASLTVAPPLAALTRTLNRTVSSTQFKVHEELPTRIQQVEKKIATTQVNNHVIYCRVPARWGLQQTNPGSGQ